MLWMQMDIVQPSFCIIHRTTPLISNVLDAAENCPAQMLYHPVLPKLLPSKYSMINIYNGALRCGAST
jgi:hypothetical protein